LTVPKAVADKARGDPSKEICADTGYHHYPDRTGF